MVILMASGREIAKQNLDNLSAWIRERDKCKDWSDYIRPCGTRLNRTEITKELGCASSVPYQNPVFKAMLENLECRLKESGVLGHDKVDDRDPAEKAAARMSSARVSKLEERVKNLEARNLAQREELKSLKRQLDQYEVMDKYLNETGRLLKR